jgi:hypothetical protein
MVAEDAWQHRARLLRGARPHRLSVCNRHSSGALHLKIQPDRWCEIWLKRFLKAVVSIATESYGEQSERFATSAIAVSFFRAAARCSAISVLGAYIFEYTGHCRASYAGYMPAPSVHERTFACVREVEESRNICRTCPQSLRAPIESVALNNRRIRRNL